MRVLKEESLTGNCKLKLVKGGNDKKYKFQIVCCDYDRKKFIKLSLVNNIYNSNKVFNNILEFLKTFNCITTSVLKQARVYYSFDRPLREEYKSSDLDNVS